jgi:hypothetical protein
LDGVSDGVLEDLAQRAIHGDLVQVPVTNLVARPKVVAAIETTGSVVNTFAPGIGSIVALALGGLYHGYHQLRNRKVNEALVQVVVELDAWWRTPCGAGGCIPARN